MATVFSEKFLQELPADTLEADNKMLSVVSDLFGQNATADYINNEIVPALMVYLAFRESRGLTSPKLQWTGESSENYNAARAFLNFSHTDYLLRKTSAQGTDAYVKAKHLFEIQSGAMFCYNFDDDDIKRIQKYLNELRELFVKADQLDDDHRQRLLKRLEQLQSELHKKVSDLDRFWGLVGDAGVVLKKFGDDTKAVRRLIYAITAIIVKVQSLAHGLPAPEFHPFLLPEGKADFDDGDMRV
jgi:hypothetical protein